MSKLVGKQIRIAIALVAGSASLFIIGAVARIKALMIIGVVLMLISPYLAVYLVLKREGLR